MPDLDNRLRLIIADESLNDAETLISVLRNAGHAVRATRVEDDEDLTEALANGQYDLMLSAIDLEALPLQRARALIIQAGRDLPLLALAASDDARLRRDALTAGAADLVSKDDMIHLQQVIKRELAHLRDRRRLRRLETALRESEKRCYTLLDSSRDAIAYVHEGMHIYANQAYLERFGFEAMDDVEGLPLLDLAAPDDQGRLKDFLRAYQKGSAEGDQLELQMASTEGDTFPVIMTFSEASIEGEPCTQILMRDTSDARQLEAQLEDLSKQDTLTGLYNRAYFMEQLQGLIKAAVDGGDGGGLLLVQLDNLDTVSRNLGITGVDLAVSAIARIIREELGDDGIAARFGDEVFGILAPGMSAHDAIALAEAIRQRLEDHIEESNGKTVTTTCSIGITPLGEISDPQAAVDCAHKGCEEARIKGGNQVHLYSPAEQAGAEGANLRRRLEEALENDGYFLVYQPVASLQGDPTEHYEVRVRLHGPEGETIAAKEFIPQAEEFELMPALDRWIITRATSALAERIKAGKNTVLFVKLSGQTLADEKFLPFLKQRLEELQLDGRTLVFQVNEPVAVTQLTQAKAVFRGLKQLKCGFSLDHFGSGLNTFQLVRHLPADFLKIDATLTHDLMTNEESRESVRQLIESAHETRRKVIGGYLEDASSLAVLWQLGADYVQGYFLSEPLTSMNYDFSGMVI